MFILSLTAEPDIVNNPTDIVLILDRSRNMAGSSLANLKNGAKKFTDIIDAGNISKPGAKDFVINDVMASCFKITSLDTPTKGTASLLSETSLQWKIDELGTHKSERTSLEFTVMHIGPCSGTIEVNESITYDDKDHNKVNFPLPKIEVDCGDAVFPESCPTPVPIKFDH